MRNWGVVITACYALILAGFVVPLMIWLAHGDSVWRTWLEGWGSAWCWVPVGLLLLGQALLVILSVDRSERRLRPRRHVLLSAGLGATMTLWLVAAAVLSVGVAIRGDKHLDEWSAAMRSSAFAGALLVGLWAVWGAFFYLYSRGASEVIERVTRWLLRGSVLELLIAIPSHVIVRRRNDCCAPMVSGFGIASGIAIMLLSFGPGILWAYKRRLDERRVRAA